MKITTGKYAGHLGTVESIAYQRTLDYPDAFAIGYYVMLDAGVTVRWRQVERPKNLRSSA